ncbi:MAG TPA: GNAT family N-acetyltransferase [Candidatus Eisenbacteria bacterium]|nr:GNAT family N-acetyltransferase [Candidatus Eisenbacteria bacterium]
MTTPTLEADPACPDVEIDLLRAARTRLRAERRPFGDIPRSTWDALAARNPWSTPFSAWAFHRSWWDAYGENAHEQTIVVLDPDRSAAEPIAIVPLMHRHFVEPRDAETHTTIRHGAKLPLTAVPPDAKTIFFGATYHADYATILGAPADLPAVAEALVERLAADDPIDPGHAMPWDVVDLRRLRCADPAAAALVTAFGAREMTAGWTMNLEREDVCPVAEIPPGIDFDGYLATLRKHHRHEIRRKLRRALAVGEVALVESTDPVADLEIFIDLHQRRWGDDGLFPPTPGGDQSRLFMRRLFELFGPGGPLRLSFLHVGPRRIGAAIHFETADTIYYYNAGIEPDARALSPGVLLVERLLRRAIERGLRRFDFMRGDESYKYEWGAADEPIQRLLVRRGLA